MRQIWAVGELSHWSDLVFFKNSAWDMMHEQACCCDEAASHQLPIVVAFWIIQTVSAEECSSLTQNLMQIHCSTHSVILNAMATQYTSSLEGIYVPHRLVQWSHHCSCMCIPVHSPWLPGYIVAHTILVLLTTAGLFMDRPRMPGSFLSASPHIKYPMLTGHCCDSSGRPTSKCWG